MARLDYRTALFSTLFGFALVASAVPAFADDATAGDAPQLRQEIAQATTPVTPTDPQTSSAPAAPNSTGSLALPDRVLRSSKIASQLARSEWLDKVAEANPAILAAICQHEKSTRILARHRHIAQLAEADHYLCRRITRFKRAADQLVENPHVDRVIQLDPEGIYYAIARDPKLAKVLSSHRMFDQMIDSNPDLGRVIAEHMR